MHHLTNSHWVSAGQRKHPVPQRTLKGQGAFSDSITPGAMNLKYFMFFSFSFSVYNIEITHHYTGLLWRPNAFIQTSLKDAQLTSVPCLTSLPIKIKASPIFLYQAAFTQKLRPYEVWEWSTMFSFPFSPGYLLTNSISTKHSVNCESLRAARRLGLGKERRNATFHAKVLPPSLCNINTNTCFWIRDHFNILIMCLEVQDNDMDELSQRESRFSSKQTHYQY